MNFDLRAYIISYLYDIQSNLLKNRKTPIKQKKYSNWHEIQAEYKDFMASLNFDSIDEVVDYLIEEYNLSRITTKKIVQGIEQRETVELVF